MPDEQPPWEKGFDTRVVRHALPMLTITVQAVSRPQVEALTRRYEGRELDLLTDAINAGAEVKLTFPGPVDHRPSFGSDVQGAEETLRALRELEGQADALAQRPEPGAER